MLSDNVFGRCEQCKRRVDTDKLIVIDGGLKGEKFFCNRCVPKITITLYPEGFNRSNIWVLMLEEN